MYVIVASRNVPHKTQINKFWTYREIRDFFPNLFSFLILIFVLFSSYFTYLIYTCFRVLRPVSYLTDIPKQLEKIDAQFESDK